MISRQTIAILLVTFASAIAAGCVAVACGPDSADEVPDDAADRYAKAMCTTYERCGCMGEGFEGMSACRDESAEIFRKMEDWPGVKFDRECFEKVLEYIEKNECGAPPSAKPFPCEVFPGTVPPGAECRADWLLEGEAGGLSAGACGSGGACYGGTCVEPPAPIVAVGEPCYLELGVRCGQDKYCGSDGTCHDEVPAGGSCDMPHACADIGSYCAGLSRDGETLGTCQARIDVGDACSSDEVESCEPGFVGYCGSTGTCAGAWPSICRAVSLPADAYDLREWIPVR